MPRAVQVPFQRIEDFRARPQRLAERKSGDGDYHELLDVDRIVRVLAAVDDIHHRSRKRSGGGSADVSVKREVRVLRGGLRDGEGCAEDCVGAQSALVQSVVQVDHRNIDRNLLGSVHARQQVGDLAVDRVHGHLHALSEIPVRIAVPEFHGLVSSRRGAGRNGCAPRAPVCKQHFDLDGRAAPAVEYFAACDCADDWHDYPWLRRWECGTP